MKKNSLNDLDTLLRNANAAIPKHEVPPSLAERMALPGKQRRPVHAHRFVIVTVIIAVILCATCSAAVYYRKFYMPGQGFVDLEGSRLYLLPETVEFGDYQIIAACYTEKDEDRVIQLYLHATTQTEQNRSIGPRMKIIGQGESSSSKTATAKDNGWFYYELSNHFQDDKGKGIPRGELNADGRYCFTIVNEETDTSVEIALADAQTLPDRTMEFPAVNGIKTYFTELSPNSSIYALQFVRETWEGTEIEREAPDLCLYLYTEANTDFTAYDETCTVMAVYEDGTSLPCEIINGTSYSIRDTLNGEEHKLNGAMIFTLPKGRSEQPVSLEVTALELRINFYSYKNGYREAPQGLLPFPENDGLIEFKKGYTMFDAYGVTGTLSEVERNGNTVSFYILQPKELSGLTGLFPVTGEVPDGLRFGLSWANVTHYGLIQRTERALREIDGKQYYVITYEIDPAHLPLITEPSDGFYYVPVRIRNVYFKFPLDLRIPIE